MLKSPVLYILTIIFSIVILIIGKKRHFSIFQYLVWLLLDIYLTIVLSLVIFPIPIDKLDVVDMQQYQCMHNNFIPFKCILDIIKNNSLSVVFRQIGGNIILFIPLGYLIPILCRKICNFKNVILVGLISSIGIESVQALISFILGITYRCSDIDDVILNTLGMIIGFVMLKPILPMVNKVIDTSHLENSYL